jgi:large repetitive protein
MLKPVVFVAILAACTNQNDVTQITAASQPGGVSPPGSVSTAANKPGFGLNLPQNGGLSSSALQPRTPAFVWASAAPSGVQPSGASPAALEAAARTHVASFASHYAYQPRQAAELELRDLHDTGSGAIIARFGRRLEGIEVFGERIAVAMKRNLEAIALSGNVSADVPAPAAPNAGPLASRFTLPPERAVRLAIADISGVLLEPADLDAARPAAGGYQSLGLGAQALAKLQAPAGTNPARIKSTLFPAARKQLLPAYYVEANVGAGPEGTPRYFAYVLSATDGAILWKRDLTAYEAYSYRVYADDTGLFTPWDGPQGTTPTPSPSGALDGYEAEFVSQNLVTLSSLESVGVTDPWLPDGATETSGNNVDAYVDISPPDGFTPAADFRARVSAPGVFDSEFDPLVDANADVRQQTAAITQLFYNTNWFHDWYYAAGFNEAAGNAQASNFGRGGLEGDALLAEAQDGSGKNNANMSTPADGMPPTMQMYLWDYGPSSLSVSEPASVAGTYVTGATSFTPNDFAASGPIVRANPVNGCAPLVGTYTGTIVLIDRGGEDCTESPIANKVLNAQLAGAVGAIIANVPDSPNPDSPANPGGTPLEPITIGAVTLNLADGDRLRAALQEVDALRGSIFRDSMLRDGDVDNQVVAHEWGHFISNRLVGDSAGLGTNMGSGLGEGWGDFHALLITVRPEDIQRAENANWEGVYPLAAYSTGTSSTAPYYFGIRRYPYSTLLSKDPLTFKHISDEAELPADVPRSFDTEHAEPHNTGEVWASMLWECYAGLLRDTLGAAPRLTFAQARDRMRDYIVAAYKLTPNNPTLLEARDALLAAALAGDPLDHLLFTSAFAKRGAGVFAVAPDRLDPDNNGVVESYAYGAALLARAATLTDDVRPVCAPDGILDPGETGSLSVTFQNVGNVAKDGFSASVSSPTQGIQFPYGTTLSVPALPIFGTAQVSLRVRAAHLAALTPIEFSIQVADAGAGTPPPSTFTFLGNADEVANQSFTDGAESSHVVWAISSSDEAVPAADRWQRTSVSVTDHYYHCPSQPLPASVDFQSPPLSLVPGEALTLSFKHRFSFETDGESNYDGGVIELSTDGGATWDDVGPDLAGYNGVIFADSGNPFADRPAFVAQSPDYPAFVNASLDLGAELGSGSVLIRFRVGSDGGTASTGWDIDDITLSGVAPPPPFDAIVPQRSHCDEQPLTAVTP